VKKRIKLLRRRISERQPMKEGEGGRGGSDGGGEEGGKKRGGSEENNESKMI